MNQLEGKQKIGNSTKIDIYTLVVLFVSIVSIINIVLLSCSYFDVRYSLTISALLTLLFLRLTRINGILPIEKPSFFFLTILIFAVLFRSDLYPNFAGGQDEGLYTNMAEIFLREKGFNFVDLFRESLSTTNQNIYDNSKLMSVVLLDSSNSLYTLSFYPLHPSWMAIFRFLFGESSHTLSLFFFSLFAIVGGTLLTKEIFQNKMASYLAAFFLSINPALVFFAKFPVTEIVAFFFTVNGFLFFLKSLQENRLLIKDLYWLIGVLCFNGLFYTRMQFFLFVPFFVFLGGLTFLNEQFKKFRKDIISFITAIFFSFFISLCFYYFFQIDLFNSIFVDTILSLINLNVFCLFILLFFLIFIYNKTTVGHNHLRKWSEKILSLGSWWLFLAFLCSIFSIVYLYNTGDLLPYRLLSHKDLGLIRYHAIYRFMLMLSPVGFIILFLSPFMKVKWNILQNLLFIFLTLVWSGILLRPYIPYLYYYGRYLVSDMLPFSLILLSGILGHWFYQKKIYLFWGSVSLITIYFLIFSYVQVGSVESDTNSFYHEIAKNVSHNDIILYNNLDQTVILPLRFTYKYSLFPKPTRINVQSEKTIMSLYNKAKKNGGRLLFMSSSPDLLDLTETLDKFLFSYYFFTNGEHRFEQGASFYSTHWLKYFLPIHNTVWKKDIYLYVLDKKILNSIFSNQCKKIIKFNSSALDTSGFSNVEITSRWTEGNLATFSCALAHKNKINNIFFNLNGVFATKEHPQHIKITVNNVVTKEFDIKNSEAQKLQIPVDRVLSDKINVSIDLPDAVSPQELDISTDYRKLGINVKSIEIEANDKLDE